jgi:hypothetical protein
MTEKEILEDHLKPLEIYGPKFVGVETGGHCQGFPDVFYSFAGHSGIIELKQMKRAEGQIRIPYRPGQLPFLIEHGRRSHYTFLLVYYGDTFYLVQKEFQREYENEKELEAASCHKTKTLGKGFLNLL